MAELLLEQLRSKSAEIRRLKQEIKDFADYRALKRRQIDRLRVTIQLLEDQRAAKRLDRGK